MYFYKIILILVITVAAAHGQEENDELKCPEGYCVSKFLCPNSTYIDDPKEAQNSLLVGLRMGLDIDDVDTCENYFLKCCKTAPVPPTAIDNADSEELTVPPPSNTECGQFNEKGLIYELHNNNSLAQYAEFPWVVYIFTNEKQPASSSSSNFVAGGALIHPRFVVTSAHNPDGKKNLFARFGEWDIGTTKEPFPQKEIRVMEITKHPNYVNNPIQNDIALLLLAENVRYQPNILPICLPEPSDVFEGARCISNGWGKERGVFANVMKKITVPVISRSNCTRMLRFAGLGPFFRLRDGFMCAGGEANVDMCKGDGGSPLACQSSTGSFVLAGIVSWGIGCGGYDVPGVYVSVANYVSWINERIVEYSLDNDMILNTVINGCNCQLGFITQLPISRSVYSSSSIQTLLLLHFVMYWRLFLILCIHSIPSQTNAQSDELYECPGGYCAPKFLCPNGVYDESLAQNKEVVKLRFGEDDECLDYMLVCCSNASNIRKMSIDESDPSDYTCGVSNPGGLAYQLEGNRSYASYGEFPWVAAIFSTFSISNVPSFEYLGGGSLIHPKFVVTAAHILKTKDNLVASFGDWDIQRDENIYSKQKINIDRNIIIHPEYTSIGFLNDIALLRLQEQVVYQKHIRPICLPEPSDVFDGQLCTSTGWGMEAHTRKYANVLKRVDLPVVSRQTCKQQFAATRLGPFFRLHKSFLCAGGEAGADTCDGDGGSALACPTSSGSYVLAGIVSWGLGCLQQDVPGAYVNVAKFASWINSVIGESEQ
ncbi:uncharacterized protein LOC128726846 [Anopheles nili]|uniref:uncharacterized protein LOC128726846 n=1 Tax=Anopheles nili TaxID=185578 RepID=UPI00237C4E3D|nr:uncharacterized protein LOC128726846 [Anopheles nili]